MKNKGINSYQVLTLEAKRQKEVERIMKIAYPHSIKTALEIAQPALELTRLVDEITAPINDLLPKDLKTSLAIYDNSLEKLFNDLNIYENTPALKSLTELQTSLDEFAEAKNEVEGNIWHEWTEAELKEKETENEALKLEMEALKQSINALTAQIEEDAEKVEMVKFIMQNHAPKPKPRLITKRSLNPSFQDFEAQVKVIAETSTPLFNATLDQWKNLFSDEIKPFKKPIELKQETTFSDLRSFMDAFKTQKLIRNGKFNSLLEGVNAFSKDGQTVTAQNLKDAYQTAKRSYSINQGKINDILKALKVVD